MRLLLGNQYVDVPGDIIGRAATRDARAWAGQYTTVRLSAPLHALRAHTGGVAFPGRPASSANGPWLMLGDVIHTSQEVVDFRSLPGPFTQVSEALIPALGVINIGIASRLLMGRGGGVQAEYVDGPPIFFTELTGKHWMGRAGTA